MSKSLVRIAVLFLSFTVIANSASAQTTGNQVFTVSVPQSLSITAPEAVSLTHDQSNNSQAFPAQPWTVKGNHRSGVSVTFEASSPFVHASDTTFKRDAKLNLSLGTVQGPAQWTMGVTEAATDYANNATPATVSASSNGVGRASFNLAVTFLTQDFSEFAAGDYQTTVVGTIAAK